MSKDFFCVLQSFASLELLVLLPINAKSLVRVKSLEKHFEEEDVERRSVKILGSLKPEQ